MAGIEAARFGRDLRQLFDGRGVVGLTEAQLVDRIARRDESAEAAFEAILRRHGPAVLACCRRVLGDTSAAEDAFQATFLVLHRRAGSIRVAESLAPWLLHVARMAALKVRRGELRRLARERRVARPELTAAEEPSSDLRLLVHDEVDRLPAKYRDPVRLCYFEGRTHDDAAASLGWPVGTVRGRLSRARDMLRMRLMRRGIGVTPVALVAAMSAIADARAAVPQGLHEATLAAAFRGAAVKVGVASLTAAVVRGLVVSTTIKGSAVVLAVVSMISAGAGFAALAGRNRTPKSEMKPPRTTAPPGAAGVSRTDLLSGEWRTSLGLVTFTRQRDVWIANFADRELPALQGLLNGKELTLKYDEDAKRASSNIKLDDSGRSFAGPFSFSEGQRNIVNTKWQGWRPDPEARKSEPGQFSGLWLTTQGLMEIEQTGNKIRGQYARYGPVKIEGTIAGRELDFRYTWLRNGEGWFDLSKDGKTLEGAAVDDGANSWYERNGRRATEFVRHAPLKAGQIVDGSTKNLLTYSVRAPEGYKVGDAKRWPTIVILHGSNMSGKAYVNSIAQAWPDIAKDYLILGLNGEVPSNLGDDPRFNYTYVNYMGRSTYKGYPGTDRESPALVSEAFDELRKVYPVERYFVGGHAQGGYLTYVMLMHFPEKIAGAFPISCQVMIQCEPDVFDNEALRAAQRSVPLAIVHGKNDPNIEFAGGGQYAANLYGEYGWPCFRLFASETAGQKFMLLPVREAIRWLEIMASQEPKVLIDFAEKQAKDGNYRDAIAALRKAKGLKQTPAEKQRADRLRGSIDTKANAKANEFLNKIRSNRNGSWLEGFLAFRDQFEFSDGARSVMASFEALRKTQEPDAQRLFNEANMQFRQGNQAGGYAKYQEIVEKDYASSRYRNVKEQLRARK
jgi:RNA polymerase sigma factor (sigma-70 family)